MLNQRGMNNELYSEYRARIEQYSGELGKVKARLNSIIILRLGAFVAALVSIYFGIVSSSNNYLLGILCFAGFLSLVRYHESLKGKAKFLRTLVKVNNDELGALSGDISSFDQGNEFQVENHNYSHDLDLFGRGSLYQYLNRSCTEVGRFKLANSLLNPSLNREEIEERQVAIQDLAKRIDWRQRFQATGIVAETQPNGAQRLKDWGDDDIDVAGGLINKVLLWVVPVFSLVALLAFINDSITAFQYLLSLLIPFGVITFHLKAINAEYAKVSKMNDLLKAYAALLKLIESEPFSSKMLKSEVNGLKVKEASAGKAIRKLFDIVSSLDNRNNIVVAVVLNALFLWDLQYIRRLMAWKREYGKHMNDWFRVISEIDALNGLANFSYNNPSFSFPKVVDEGAPYDAVEMGHPLIQGDKRIDNDFKLDGKQHFVILTGANMAGKSTFLRTLGINLLLAMVGAPTCSKSFSFIPMNIFSSMRTSDSLQDSESYFFTELKRLKMLVEKIQAGVKLFILLDEILKGTNSVDKEKGSKAFVKRLIDLNTNGVIATHDLSLCQLSDEHPEQIVNKCFEAEMNNNELTFDYKIREGVCQNMNATFLLKKMGIVDQ